VEETIALDDLVRFVEHPVKAFLRQRLGVRISDLPDEVADELTLEADGLARYALGDRLLRARLAGLPEAEVVAAERARGGLPPAGALQEAVFRDVMPCVEAIARRAEGVLPSPGLSETRDVLVVLPDGRRLAGTVTGVAGDAVQAVSYATLKAKHRLAAWVRLLALAAAGEPVRRAVTVGRRGEGGVVATCGRGRSRSSRSWPISATAGCASRCPSAARRPRPTPPASSAAARPRA
jgi:exodeoxyribonuclease V gamma subunit